MTKKAGAPAERSRSRRTSKLDEELGRRYGWPARRFEDWRSKGLGPRWGDPRHADRHWETLAPLMGSGRDADVAAVRMAAAGYCTDRLAGAVDRLASLDRRRERDDTGISSDTMAEATLASDPDTFTGRVLQAMLRRSDNAGDPWGNKSEEHPLHHRGRVQAVVTETVEASRAPGTDLDDPDDADTVLGAQLRDDSGWVAFHDPRLGPWADDMRRDLRRLRPDLLVHAVRAATDLVPFALGSLGAEPLSPTDGRRYWQAVAFTAAMVVTFYDRLARSAAEGLPERLRLPGPWSPPDSLDSSTPGT